MDTQRIQKLEEWVKKVDAVYAASPTIPNKYPLPSHRFSVHWIPLGIESHKDYIRKLKPAAVKIVNGNQQDIALCQQNIDKNGIIVLRDHARSEQQDFLARDPVGCGKQHALEWKKDFENGGKYYGLDKSKFVVCGLNEPFVRGPEEEKKLLDYTIAFLNDLKSYGMRGMCLNLSVGWPRNGGGNTPPIWDTFLPLEKIINDGNHILGLHEYWYDDPDEEWAEINGIKFGWRAHRHHYCPLQVPIIIGECGLTKAVDYERWNNDGRPNKGWIGNKTPDQYAEQLWRYARKCSPNVIGVMPFTTGFASQDWAEDATDTAHPFIISRKESYTFPANFPIKPNSPVVENPPMNTSKTIVIPKMTGKITGFYGSVYTNKLGTYAHEGVDVGVVTGTPIYAPYDGIVAWSDIEPNTYGEYIRTYHKSLGVCFLFGHMSQRLVKTGDEIKQGQLMGYSGNTGNSTGSHIHISVRFMEKDSNVYRKNVSAHSKSEVDLFGFIAGWIAAGNEVVEK